MRGRSLFHLLLTPSVLSTVSVIVVAAVLLSASDIYYFAHDSLIYDYLFGPHGQITILEEGASGISAVFAALFSQPLGYDVLVFLGALIVGFMMYAILQVSSRGFFIVISTLLNVSLAQATGTKRALEIEIGSRIGFRLTTIVLWFLYWQLSLKIILPFCVLTSRVGTASLDTVSGWLYCLLSYALLVLALHLHVIFIRLFTLRPRLFGGRDVMLAILENRH
jgi:hypothetical protein